MIEIPKNACFNVFGLFRSRRMMKKKAEEIGKEIGDTGVVRRNNISRYFVYDGHRFVLFHTEKTNADALGTAAAVERH